MRFDNPAWLFLLTLILLLPLLFWFSDWTATRRLLRFASERLLPQLSVAAGWLRWFRRGLLLLAIALLVVALARPQMGYTLQEVRATGVDVLFALDVSRSMRVPDLAPDRLTRAKLAVLDMVETSKGQRVGLIAFAGTAFTQCPLTLDYGAFRQSLDSIGPDSIPRQGTDLAAAIAEAELAFGKSENRKVLVLLSDGEDLEAAGLKRARELKGVTILAIGVGTAEGGPVPAGDRGAGYTRDTAGKTVISRLDPQGLQDIAEASKGRYLPIQSANLAAVYAGIVAGGGGGGAAETSMRLPNERYQWPLGAALVLLIIESLMPGRKRHPAAAAVLLALCLIPADAAAASLRRAQELLFEENYAAAAGELETLVQELPNDPRVWYNLGVAAYRSGDAGRAQEAFEKAADAGGGDDTAFKAQMNAAASAVAHASSPGEPEPRKLLENAKDRVERALSMRPEDEAARRLHQRIVEALEQSEEQRQQPQQDGGQKEDGQDGEGQEQNPQQDGSGGQQGSGQQEDRDNDQPGEEGQQGDNGQDGQGQSNSDGQGQEPQQQPNGSGQEEDESSSDGSYRQGESTTESERPAGQQGQAGEQQDGTDGPDEATASAGEAREAYLTDADETLSEEEARMILQRLQRQERTLPAAREQRGDASRAGRGRDW